MVARNRVRCTIISVPVGAEIVSRRGSVARELVPGADPYVAQLIKNLQDEVREERRQRSALRHYRYEPVNRLTRHFESLESDHGNPCDAAW